MDKNIKAECVRRMIILDIDSDGSHSCLNDFIKTGKVWKSELHGKLSPLNEQEEQLVKAFEEKYKDIETKVYHCYKAYSNSSEILYMIFYSNNEDECFVDFDTDIKSHSTFCYAEDLTDSTRSTFGLYHIEAIDGGVLVNKKY